MKRVDHGFDCAEQTCSAAKCCAEKSENSCWIRNVANSGSRRLHANLILTHSMPKAIDAFSKEKQPWVDSSRATRIVR